MYLASFVQFNPHPITKATRAYTKKPLNSKQKAKTLFDCDAVAHFSIVLHIFDFGALFVIFAINPFVNQNVLRVPMGIVCVCICSCANSIAYNCCSPVAHQLILEWYNFGSFPWHSIFACIRKALAACVFYVIPLYFLILVCPSCHCHYRILRPTTKRARAKKIETNLFKHELCNDFHIFPQKQLLFSIFRSQFPHFSSFYSSFAVVGKPHFSSLHYKSNARNKLAMHRRRNTSGHQRRHLSFSSFSLSPFYLPGVLCLLVLQHTDFFYRPVFRLR